jgi:hypothetical protein|nr:hypothetical protein [Kofleriaceae bacterium]
MAMVKRAFALGVGAVVLGGLTWVGSCFYQPHVADCVLQCTSDDDCAGGQICDITGMCASSTMAGHCGGPGATADGGPTDAGVPDDSAPPVDAPKHHGDAAGPVDAPKPPIDAPKPPIDAPAPPIDAPKPPIDAPAPPVDAPPPPPIDAPPPPPPIDAPPPPIDAPPPPPPPDAPPPPPPKQITISVNVHGTGTVTMGAQACSNGKCNFTSTAGTPVELAASADFQMWSGACSGPQSTCDITPMGNANVDAHFMGGG